MSPLKLYSIILINLYYFNSFSQVTNPKTKEKIRNIKVALIKTKIKLTDEQSEEFWSVYNKIDKKRIESRTTRSALLLSACNMTNSDAKIIQELRESINQKQKELDLERELFVTLQKILTPRQLAELFKTEVEFRNKLLHKIEN